MTRFESLRSRLEDLEESAHRGLIPTTDETGRRAWLEGGGLSLAFRLMEIQDEGGEIPDDLRREAGRWSRSFPESPAEREVKSLCEKAIS
jgi:hypothetical protein